MYRFWTAFFLASFVFSGAPKISSRLSKDEQILHAANRLTFGATPQDIAAIRKVGVEKWVDQQLRPETIAENPALTERLRALDSLGLSNAELIQKYPPPQLIRNKKKEDGEANAETMAARQAVRKVYTDLAEAKVLRAVHSNRQLEELLTDFWFNHFNVFFDKGFDRVLVTSYERDAIRPHVLGNFRDLLLATARHPAMLFYLDNWTSVSTDGLPQVRRKAAAKQKRAAGLNENYARELLELHTMGVDGGYTQKDVTEVARCFTGWSIAEIREGGKFQFRPMLHDRKAKQVLGEVIQPGRGEEDGLEVIDILVRHPATARFISTKLAQRFVSDAPPETLITKMAATFTKSRGDLRAVTRTMLTAPEFWAPEAYQAKMKMPLEMIASALRATGAEVTTTAALQQELRTMGQPLYRKVEPTGYTAMAEEWTNSAALLARMNFGIQLTQNKVRGVRVDLDGRLGGKRTAAAIAEALLLRAPAAETLAALETKADATPARVAGLVLGGPEFQRR
ncbi:MAG TPA: DUF1800 domain-containing protein [Bryobacteraceae bacterium]|nr:DUF1800 domain-containing protein [Bryobacteraceae bacterium]